MTPDTRLLGEVVRFVGGGTPDRSNPDYWDGSVPWATVKDFNTGAELHSPAESITQLGLQNSASNLVDVGTVVIPTRMALGKAAITLAPTAINQDLKAVIPTTEELDTRYLLRYFLANSQKIEAMGKGATVKGVTLDQLRSLQIPCPPLPEQRRIAAILDKADALRAKRREAIAKLDQLLESVFLEMFGEAAFNPVPVGDLVNRNAGGIRTGPFGSQLLHSEFVDEGVAVLGIDNAVTNSFTSGKQRYITTDKYEKLKRYTVYPGDVLITIMGTCGRCAVVPSDVGLAINTKHLCCITLDETRCLPEFLHSYFLMHPSAQRYLRDCAKGAIMDGLNMGIIKELPVPLPPIAAQAAFTRIKESIGRMIRAGEVAESHMAGLTSSIQKSVFK